MFHWVSFIEVILEFFPSMRSFGKERWGDTQFLKGREESVSVSVCESVCTGTRPWSRTCGRLVEWPSALGGGRRRSTSMVLKTCRAAASQAGGCIWSVTCNWARRGYTKPRTDVVINPQASLLRLFIILGVKYTRFGLIFSPTLKIFEASKNYINSASKETCLRWEVYSGKPIT